MQHATEKNIDEIFVKSDPKLKLQLPNSIEIMMTEIPGRKPLNRNLQMRTKFATGCVNMFSSTKR